MDIYRLTQSDTSEVLNVVTDAMVFITGDHSTLGLNGSSNDTIQVFGQSDGVSFFFTHDITIHDHGSGTRISSSGAPQNLTIYDFQHDPTGSVHVGREGNQPVLASDNRGGTLVTFGSTTGSIDFVGDKHVTVSGVPGDFNFFNSSG